MMKIVSGTRMADIDREAMRRFAIPGLILMENAGLQVVRYMEGLRAGPWRGRVLICCGKGNNGGDGFVIARHLARLGCRPAVWAMGPLSAYRGDAAVNYGILLKQGYPVSQVTERNPQEMLKELG